MFKDKYFDYIMFVCVPLYRLQKKQAFCKQMYYIFDQIFGTGIWSPPDSLIKSSVELR